MRVSKNDDLNITTVRSDHNGPIVINTILGTDNLISNKKIEWKYQAVKPYTSLRFPTTDRKVATGQFEGYYVPIQAPSPETILKQLRQDQFEVMFKRQFAEGDQYAHNGAIENSLAYGDLLLYVTAGEAKQTLIMVRKIFITLFNAIIRLKRKAQQMNVPATLDVLSDLWLEWRYGWRPFIAEAQALHDVLTRLRPNGVKSAHGNHKTVLDKKQFAKYDVVVENEMGYIFDYTVTFSTKNLTSKCGFNFLNADSSRNDDWMSVLGLDLNSLLNTAWEVIPFSFVVDMFLNIGSILQTQNSSEQVDSFNYYKTHRHSGVAQLTCKRVTKKPTKRVIDVFNPILVSGIRFYNNEIGGTQLSDSLRKRLSKVSLTTRAPFENWGDKKLDCALYGYGDALGADVIAKVRYNTWLNSWQLLWVNKTTGQYSNNERVPYGTDALIGCLSYFHRSNPVERIEAWLNEVLFQVPPAVLRPHVDKIVQLVDSGMRPDDPRGYKPLFSSLYNYPTRLHSNGHTVLHSGVYSFGTDFEYQPKVTVSLRRLSYIFNYELFTRSHETEFSHSFSYDIDLSEGQWADLAALSYSLTRGFLKRKK